MAFNKACVVGLEPIREVISLGAIAGQSLRLIRKKSMRSVSGRNYHPP